MSTPPDAMRSWMDPEEDGQTPLDPDEAQGLKPSFVATRADLNAAEAMNIIAGMKLAESQVRPGAEVASDLFLRELHARLFGQVWTWAGEYRTTERNIGIDPARITMAVRQLFDEVAGWQEYGSYPLDEQAARLHHRLTFIHPFPNGNGRTSRAMADLFLRAKGAPALSWGASLPAADVRARYLAAVRAADEHDFSPLLDFIRL
ncbi:mobile mystery protein B [Lysobacter sp. A421]